MTINNMQDALETLAKANYPTPIAMPALYGPRSYLVGSAVVENPTAEDMGCKYSIGFSFRQTAEQEALSNSIAQQAATGSVSGLRSVFDDGSALMKNPEKALLSLAFNISALIDFAPGGDEDSKNVVTIYSGPLVSFILPPINTAKMDDELSTFIRNGNTLLTTRIQNIVNSWLDSMDAYAKLMEQTASVSADAFGMDDDVDFAAPAATLQQQQKLMLSKINVRAKNITAPAPKASDLDIKDLTIRELVSYLADLFETDAQPILIEVLSAVEDITSFLSYSDSDEAEEVSEDASE